MKRTSALAIATLLALGLSGCAGAPTTPEDTARVYLSGTDTDYTCFRDGASYSVPEGLKDLTLDTKKNGDGDSWRVEWSATDADGESRNGTLWLLPGDNSDWCIRDMSMAP